MHVFDPLGVDEETTFPGTLVVPVAEKISNLIAVQLQNNISFNLWRVEQFVTHEYL